jgi:hypothetical protein
MTGSGLSDLMNEISNMTGTPRPYKLGIPKGIMDMDAFVTDVQEWWPLKSQKTDAAKSSASTTRWEGINGQILGVVFLASSLAIGWF